MSSGLWIRFISPRWDHESQYLILIRCHLLPEVFWHTLSLPKSHARSQRHLHFPEKIVLYYKRHEVFISVLKTGKTIQLNRLHHRINLREVTFGCAKNVLLRMLGILWGLMCQCSTCFCSGTVFFQQQFSKWDLKRKSFWALFVFLGLSYTWALCLELQWRSAILVYDWIYPLIKMNAFPCKYL